MGDLLAVSFLLLLLLAGLGLVRAAGALRGGEETR